MKNERHHQLKNMKKILTNIAVGAGAVLLIGIIIPVGAVILSSIVMKILQLLGFK